MSGAAFSRSQLSFGVHSFNAARGFVSGAAAIAAIEEGAQECFNAARGFVSGAANTTEGFALFDALFQCRTRLCEWCSLMRSGRLRERQVVSMPHAALWVVQRYCPRSFSATIGCFNAARGFVGGAAIR